MKNEFYRITYDGIGIYQYLKEYLWNNIDNPLEVWNNFIKSEHNNWLKKPPVYNNGKEYNSYFNKKGYERFKNETLPLILKYLDEKNIVIDKIILDNTKIIYQDEYQVVVEFNTLEKARDFCNEVKQLANKYNLSFFVVTEGASAISNNGCDAVKHARDCHINWEKEHGFDPYEDWSKE